MQRPQSGIFANVSGPGWLRCGWSQSCQRIWRLPSSITMRGDSADISKTFQTLLLFSCRRHSLSQLSIVLFDDAAKQMPDLRTPRRSVTNTPKSQTSHQLRPAATERIETCTCGATAASALQCRLLHSLRWYCSSALSEVFPPVLYVILLACSV